MATDQDRSRRALVVVNERVEGDELRDSLLRHLDDDAGEVFVVAPAISDSGLKFVLGDVDDSIPPAEERLEGAIEELRRAGFDASGEVGDSDPIQAIHDEIVKVDPDQILVVAHGDEDGAFAERGLLAQIQRDVELPVTEIVVDSAREPHVLDVERTDPGAGRRRGWQPSFNWPPLSNRDLAGILVAVLGTLFLAGLAAMCAAEDSGELGGLCAARILIALAAALINLAHVVGLFLFQSVGYQGLWNRFFAKLSLYGTITAIAVSLGLGLFL